MNETGHPEHIQQALAEPHAPPEHLSKRSQRLWRSLVPHRALSQGRLTLLRSALESLDRADEAREALDRDGLLLASTEKSKMSHLNPLVRVEKDSRAQFFAAWMRLGFQHEQRVDGYNLDRKRQGF